MFLTHQRTISHKVSCKGHGLHSNKNVTITFLPAEEDAGIVFKRTDTESGKNEIIAKYNNVCDTTLGTVIKNKHGTKVSVIEHLMAAIWSSRITNLIIEIDNEEVPAMDGSAEPFIFMLASAGMTEQKALCKTFEITKEVRVEEGDKFISIKPYDGFAIDMKVDFPGIGKQEYKYDFKKSPFKENISRARTFCYEKEVEYMRSKGLALGGSLDNAVVLKEDGSVINKEGFRYKDEIVKHKVLDCIGDIYLCGFYNIKGHIEANKTGHTLNNLLLRKLFDDKNNYKII
jgi:UDP-3-O-[3-hydroxymyristoyl] N-acetylglucosamine deacetylase